MTEKMFDYAKLDAAAADHDVISLDVFDTILHRVCHPDVVIELTCERIADQLALSSETVMKARNKAVRRLRAKSASVAAQDHEYHIADLPRAICEALGRADVASFETVKKCIESELSTERQAVFPNADMIAFAKRQKVADKRLIAISDMYLSAENIELLLTRVGAAGIFDPADIFVSGTHSMNKHSGKLFHRVLAGLNTTPDKVLHIGDNAHSDIRMARQSGLSVSSYNADKHHERYGRFKTLSAIRADPGFALHEAGLSALDERINHDRIASHIAPVLCHFILSLIKQSTADGVSDLWFMARDGYLLKALYDAACEHVKTKVRSHYFFVSRKAVTFASSANYGIREAFLAEWNGESRRLKALLAPLKLSNEELQDISSTYGFISPDETLDQTGDPRFVKLLASKEIMDRMQKECGTARDRLMAYLHRSGFLGSARPAVVDVGWAGQIQEALAFSLDLAGTEKAMHGYYMGLRKLGGLRRLAGISMRGLTYDCADYSWEAESIIHSVEVFEDSCRATHGTVIGYNDAGIPQFANDDNPSFRAEIPGNPRIRALQESIKRYAERWFQLAFLCDVSPDKARPFAMQALTTLARFPNKEEAVYFSGIDHALDSGNDIVLSNNLVRFTINPLGLRRQMHKCRWKTGALTTMPFSRLFQAARAVMAMRGPSEKTVNSGMVEWGNDEAFAAHPGEAFQIPEIPADMEHRSQSTGTFYKPGSRGAWLSAYLSRKFKQSN